MDILPIGSVIELNGIELLIMGYYRTEEIQMKFHYILTLFPFGYVGNDKTILLPIDSKYNIVFRGYEDEECRNYLNRRGDIIETLDNRNMRELEKILNKIVEAGKKEAN